MRTLTLALAFLAASWALPAAAQTPQPLTGIVKVAVGISHACALTQAGGVLCWGNNGGGQLGIGSQEQRHSPVDVPSLRSGVVDIAAGQGSFTCALTAAGDVKCWGANGSGQLGDGTTIQRLSPVQTLAGAISISAGSAGACAVTTSGQVKCWGANTVGQVGDNTTTSPRLTPTDVTGLTDAVQVSSGGGHSCAVTTGGAVKCWGSNGNGQIGDSSLGAPRLAPVDVAGLASGVASVDAGSSHSCALRGDGTVACWGQGALGQIGDGNASSTNRLTPVDVAGGFTFTTMRAGSATTCAVTTTGAAMCWGQGSLGGLGTGSLTNANAPSEVNDLAAGVTFIDANGNGGCAVLGASGALYCWGNNGNGQLGINDFNRVPTPTPIAGGLAFAKVSAGAAHACGLTTGGAVYCWGTGAQGAIGDNSSALREVPTPVLGLGSGVTAISVYGNHSCALTAAGGVKCWGTATAIGDGGTVRLQPVDVTGLTSGVTAIAAGANHTCALVSEAVKCWGLNSSGQVGDNSNTTRLTPVDVVGFEGIPIFAITAGENHTCARDAADRAWCWGANNFGQLGIGSTTPSPTPVLVTLPNVLKISAGNGHTCAVTAVNTLYCWGSGTALGNNTTANSTTPVLAFGTGLQIDAATTGGIDFTCGHLTDNSLRCTGKNQLGQLGNNTVTPSTLTPVLVDGGPWASVTAGNDFACAITPANAGYCWGFTDRAQTGTGIVGYSLVPLAVLMFDTAPASFAFDPQVDVPLNTTRTSNTVTVTGIDAGTPISITGGSYSIGCTASFTTVPGSIGPGATLCVRHTSAAALSTLTTTRVVVGNFEAVFTSTTVPTWQLGVNRSGPGTNTVTSDPAGINCGTTCSAPFLPGVPVTLTAVASSTTRHTGWSGGSCDAVGAAPCVVTLTANTTVTAIFVAKTSQTISFATPPNHPITDPPFTVSATASSGLPVAFSSLTLPVCTVADGVVTIVAAGSCTIRASQAGDGTFLAASNADRTFSITKLAQTITFGTLDNRPLNDSPFPVSATASSGLTVAFTSTTTPVCTVASGQVTLVAQGLCTIRATQPGDGTYLAATNVSRSFTVTAAHAPARPRADLNNDGKADLVFRNADGRVAVWLMDGLTVLASDEIFPAGTAWQVAHVADLDGDGKADLVWQNPDGRITVYLMDGTTATLKQNLLPAGGGWTVTQATDLDGDGKADLVFQNTDGTVAAYLMDGATVRLGLTLIGAGSGWSITKVGDFDGDGKSDVVWTHADGRVAIWLMDGLAVKSTNQILDAATGWSVAHVTDLDGDGKADLIWRNTDGTVAAWLMNGASMGTGLGLVGPGTGWSVTHTGDFDNDGKADLLWTNTDGRVAIWLMNGLAVKSSQQILDAGTGWTVRRVQDLDGDGKADLVWEHTDGRIAAWLMNGTVLANGGTVLEAGTGWSVTPAAPN